MGRLSDMYHHVPYGLETMCKIQYDIVDAGTSERPIHSGVCLRRMCAHTDVGVTVSSFRLSKINLKESFLNAGVPARGCHRHGVETKQYHMNIAHVPIIAEAAPSVENQTRSRAPTDNSF